MAIEKVVSFFDNNGTPATGLTPSISAIDIQGNPLFSGQMNEIGFGRYDYVIQNYNKNITYLISVDGGVSLPADSRRQYTSNELDSYENKGDRRGNTIVQIDEKKLAKEIWNTDISESKDGTYGSIILSGIDYDKINKEIDKVTKEIKSITIPKIDIPKGLSFTEIEGLFQKYKDNDNTLKSIESALNIMNKVNNHIESIYNEISEINVNNKLTESLDIEGVKESLDDMKTYLSTYDVILNDVGMIPRLLDQYTKIINNLGGSRELEDKMAYMTLIMKDILYNVKK